MEHLDFELVISPSPAGVLVRVVGSPAGEASALTALPVGPEELGPRLELLATVILGSAEGRRRGLSAAEQTVSGFGRALFDAVFTGEVRSRYDVSRSEADRRGAALRIKLVCDTPELGALPWEFLFDARGGEYLTLSRATPIVRYIELPSPLEVLRLDPPLRVLALGASPEGLAPLGVEEERHRLETAVAGLRDEGVVELVWLEGSSWRHLQDALRTGPWHVLHFVGHGGFDASLGRGVLVFADDDGTAQPVDAVNVGRLLGDHLPLRLAILNACEGGRSDGVDLFSSTAAAIVRRGTPAVIAMQHPITDTAAVEFARSFYGAVTDGLPIESAVAEARKAMCIALPGTLEWGTPALHTHASDGVLFDLRGGTGAPRAQAAAAAGTPPSRHGAGRHHGARRRAALVAAAAVVTLLLASGAVALARSGDDGTGAAGPPPAPVTLQDRLVAARLSVADLPGWSPQAEQVDEPWPCATAPTPAPVATSGPLLVSSRVLVAQTSVYAYASAADAGAALADLRRIGAACVDFPEGSGEVRGLTTYTVAEDPDLGDEALALSLETRLATRGELVVFDGGLAFVRRGRFMSSAQLGIPVFAGDDIGRDTSAFFARVDAKLRAHLDELAAA